MSDTIVVANESQRVCIMCDIDFNKRRRILSRRDILATLGATGLAALAAGCKTTGLSESIRQHSATLDAKDQATLLFIRPGDERGSATQSWLDSRFSFSFADYRDSRFNSFRALRVLNEDWISGDSGFPMHPHRDMEIVTWVLDGELEHRDSTGGGGVITPGEPQRMSAGTGIRHSEFNPAQSERTHLLQIWLHPDRAGHRPGYEQSRYDAAELENRIRPVATPDGRDGSVRINQNASILAGRFQGHDDVVTVGDSRFAWTQIARGAAVINGIALQAGDGAAWVGGGELQVRSEGASEVLFFDLG